MEVITKTADETKKVAKEFMTELMNMQKKGATIVELVGDLGAGKTTFAQGIGEFFGVEQHMVSPTFMIQRNYEIPAGFPWKRLIHIDAYRIEDSKELKAIRFDDYASDENNIIFIEWPMNMKIDLPNSKRIEFFHINEHERKIKI